MIIIYILLGIVALGIALFLLKFIAILVGPALLFGGISWLVFDSFWPGCVLGGAMTLITFIRNPGKFLSDAAEEAASSSEGNSKKSVSSSSTGYRILDKYGNWREVVYMDGNHAWDEYGNEYVKGDFDRWYSV